VFSAIVTQLFQPLEAAVFGRYPSWRLSCKKGDHDESGFEEVEA
jgi:hypothetical protein